MGMEMIFPFLSLKLKFKPVKLSYGFIQTHDHTFMLLFCPVWSLTASGHHCCFD